nr:integrase, catalytic region, zinc finger, CCHC-type, peptidase aspartic, catalytic [Tanacetum cinerariifolium]
MQTQTSNTLHNAIMEAGGKDRPPMLAPGNYVQWKSRIKRYIDTKPNHELIHYCLKNPPYKFTWADKEVLISEAIERLKQGEPINVQDLKTNLYWEFRKFTSQDGESLESYYSRSQQAATRNRGKAIVNSPTLIYDQEPSMVDDDDEMSKDKEIDKLMALISLSSTGYESQRIGNVVGARETVEQADWRDDTNDENKDQELEAQYMYMAKIQEVTPDASDTYGPIFNFEPLQKASNDDNYNVFSIESEHPEQSKSVHNTYLIKQDKHNVIIDSLDMSYDREQIDQNDDDNDLANERELLASLIEKLKCEIDDSKNCNKFLEISNKVLVNKLKVEIDCAKAKGYLLSYKMESQKSFNKYTQTINDLNQTISKMKKGLSAHQETISILSQAKEAQIKLYKTREDKELDKVIALENKVKVLDNIVYKTGQSVQTMNMLNRNCKASFAKPEFLKKVQRANPRMYDIGFYNDNLALMLAPESDEVIRLEKESRSKLSDLIRPFDYDKLNNLYDLFVPQREKSSEQRYFLERSRMSHTHVNHGNSKESFNKQTNLLEKRMDESISWDQKCKSSKELFKIKRSVGTIFDEVEHLKAQLQDKGIAISELKKFIEKLKGKSMDTKFEKLSVIRQPNAFKSQRPSILGKPTIFSNSLGRKDFSNSKSVTKNNVSNDFSKPVTTQILPPNKKSILKNTNVLALGMYKLHTEPTQTRTPQLPNDSSLNAKSSNVNFVCATCGKCMFNDKHDMCVLKTLDGLNSRTKMPIDVPVRTRESKRILVEIFLFIVDSGCSKHMTGNLNLLINFVEKFLGTVKFGNDQIAPILGYGDLVQGAVTIKMVYYVEGLNHNLFFVGQFCDADLEVAFRKSTCSHGTDLYLITLQDTSSPKLICLMAKATSSQAWLWRHHLSHLNFDTINLLSKNDIVVGLPKLKFVKDHLCSSYKGTKFLNKTLHAYFAFKGITHQMSVARTPEQNGVVERWNGTLVEVARTVLSAAKVPLFFWAEAIATCFNQNRSLVISRHEKTPYHIINDRKPSVKFFHIFVSLCYIVRDGENLDKRKEKGDACIFVGYSTQSRAYRVVNKRTRVIVETIHVNFDELPQMALNHVSSDPVPQCQRTKLEHDSLSLGPQSQENVPHIAGTGTTSNELD